MNDLKSPKPLKGYPENKHRKDHTLFRFVLALGTLVVLCIISQYVK